MTIYNSGNSLQNTQAMLRFILVFLLVFNSVGAFYGSFLLIADPSGIKIGLPPDMLEGSPFQDYFVPGIILLLVNGILPLTAAIGLIARRPLVPFPYFPVFRKYHWGWTLALFSGLGLTTWIAVQILMLGYYSSFPIQSVMGVLGILITLLALFPGIRKLYKLGMLGAGKIQPSRSVKT